jgi:hypothetical protein
MVNPGEALVNVVTKDKPKMLLQNGVSRARRGAAAELGLGPKAVSGPEAPNSSGADVAPPVERRDLNHPACFTGGTW